MAQAPSSNVTTKVWLRRLDNGEKFAIEDLATLLEAIKDGVENITIDADSVNLNTDQLETLIAETNTRLGALTDPDSANSVIGLLKNIKAKGASSVTPIFTDPIDRPARQFGRVTVLDDDGNTIVSPRREDGHGSSDSNPTWVRPSTYRAIITGLSFSVDFTAVAPAAGGTHQTAWVRIDGTNWLDIIAEVPSNGAVGAVIETTDAANPNVTPPSTNDIIRAIPQQNTQQIGGTGLGGYNVVSFGIPAQQTWARITVTSLTGAQHVDVVTYDHDTPPTPAQLPIAANLATDFRAAVVRSVGAGVRLDGSIGNIKLGEHTLDSANRLVTLLTNGVPAEFTVDPGTDVFTSPTHGLVNGNPVVLSNTGGALPTPLTASTTSSAGVVSETVYWVINATTDTFQLATSPTSSTPVNVTGAGTGMQFFQRRGMFLGSFVDYSQVGHLLPFYLSNVKPAIARIEWSDNGTTQVTRLLSSSAIPINAVEAAGIGTLYVGIQVTQSMLGKYGRTRIVNGPADMTPGLSVWEVIVGKDAYQGSFSGLEASLTEFSTALLARAVIAGTTPDGGFRNQLLQGRHTDNSTTTPLPGDTGGIDHKWRGVWVEWQDKYTGAVIEINSNVAGTGYMQFSQAVVPVEGTDESVTDSIPIPYDPARRELLPRTLQLQSRWCRPAYDNGPAGQGFFSFDTAFLTTANVQGTQPIAFPPNRKNLATMTQAVAVVEKHELTDEFEEEDNESEFVHVKGTLNTRTMRRGMHSHLTGIDEPIPIKPVSTLRTGQANILSTGATPVPPVALPQRATLRFCNLDPEKTIFFSEDPDKLTGQADVVFPLSPVEIDLDEGEQLYFQIEDAGGTTQAGTDYGTGTTNNSGVTNPDNLLLDDASYAIFDNVGDSVEVNGFAAPGALPEVEQVIVKFKGRKAASPATETVTVHEVQQGATTGSSSVSTAPFTAGEQMFHLAYISRNSATSVIQSVTGHGLTWQPVPKTGGGTMTNITVGNRRVDVWYAYGSVTAGAVTAVSSISTNMHIQSICILGADPTTPVQAANFTTGTGTAVVGPSIAGTALGLSVIGISHQSSGAAGAGYTERFDAANGAGGNVDGLSTETKPLIATGGEAGTYTLATSNDWAALAVTVLPAPTEAPVIRISHMQGGTEFPTTLNATLSATSDGTYEVDITADAVWTPALIATLKVRLELLSKGAANAEGNVVWLHVVEATEGNFARMSYSEVGGGLQSEE